jgi:hypothetical protein
MKDIVTSDTAPAEFSGFEDIGDYTICADAKMFKILIAGLYSDKIRAIVRELCSNARDSHAAAGILDRPFRLQIPTRWDDAFSVRDFGVSLTHDQVMHLYTTVGKSTKHHDNVSVGKWGLGSKTPFAYTDSFSLIVILDGEKRIYNAFMDSGTPRIALLVREPTDEEQGVEVTFPVQPADRGAFLTAARRELLGFDVIPENNVDITKPELNVLFEGADWKIVSRDYDLGLHGPFVKQGCVLYPIDTTPLRAVRASEALDAFNEEVLIVEMPIGSVDITPSRESLSYDPITVKNLLDRLDGVFEEVSDKFVGGVNDAKSLFEAVRERNRVMNGIRSYMLKTSVAQKLRYRGRKIPESVQVSREMVKVLKTHGVNLMQITTPSGKSGRRSAVRRMSLGTMYSGFNVNPDAPPVFVYLSSQDTPKWMPYRLAAANTVSSDRVIFLEGFTPGSKAESYLHVALGRPDVPLNFVDLMTVPFTRPDRNGGARSAVPMNVLRGSWVDFKPVEEDDIEGSVYYVRTYKNITSFNGREYSYEQLKLIFKTLRDVGMIENDALIVAIPASRKEYAKAVPEGWDDFLDYAQRKVALNFDADLAVAGTGLQEFRGSYDNMRWIDTVESLAAMHTSPALSAALAAVRTPFEAKQSGATHRKLLGILDTLFERSVYIEMRSTEMSPELAALEAAKEAFMVAYPLLPHVGWSSLSYRSDAQEHAVEYMLLRDIAAP